MSGGIYGSLNGGVGSNDDPADVEENRRRMAEQLGVSAPHFLTLWQTHSPDVVVASEPWQGASRPRADAIVTRTEVSPSAPPRPIADPSCSSTPARA